jgi:transposase
MRVRYGRAPRGSRANVTTTALRAKNFSICAAMSCQSMALFKVEERAYNKEKFGLYLVDFIALLRTQNINRATLIMDNVAFHKAQEISRLVCAHGHAILFLPPYSPFLNPIENAFNQWKQAVRRAACTTEEELMRAIQNGAAEISRENCEGYYRNMERYIPDCIEKKRIEN